MKAGELRFRVTVERPILQDNSFGESAVSYESVAEVWAGIKPMLATEKFRAGKAQHEVTHEIRMRYAPYVHPACRLRYEDAAAGLTRYFNIHSMLDVNERHSELEMLCVEVTQYG